MKLARRGDSHVRNATIALLSRTAVNMKHIEALARAGLVDILVRRRRRRRRLCVLACARARTHGARERGHCARVRARGHGTRVRARACGHGASARAHGHNARTRASACGARLWLWACTCVRVGVCHVFLLCHGVGYAYFPCDIA